jgi:hypothetical protein
VFIKIKNASLCTENNRLIRSEKRIKNIKGWSIQLNNRIKNIEGQSTSSEVAPEYFGAKGALSLKNENIICDKCNKLVCLTLAKNQP